MKKSKRKLADMDGEVSTSSAQIYLGVRLDQIQHLSSASFSQVPEPVPSSIHSVLCKVPADSTSAAPAAPSAPPPPQIKAESPLRDDGATTAADGGVHRWDATHVRLPCSPQSTIAGTKGQKRWVAIETALADVQFKSSQDVADAILSYNANIADKLEFTGWHRYCNSVLDADERRDLFDRLLPAMARLALQLPHLITKPIPLLSQSSLQRDYEFAATWTSSSRCRCVSLSQQQISCLMASAFFCTFPHRHPADRSSEYKSFPDFDFSGLFKLQKPARQQAVFEKLRCLLHYFSRVAPVDGSTPPPPAGVVTVMRVRHEYSDVMWTSSDKPMTQLHVTSCGNIEDDGRGLMQVDFADKVVGGFVLSWGCVQEEIRFVLCPELIVCRLLCENMNDNEAILVKGIDQYSTYSGYGNSFRWTGDYREQADRDVWQRRQTIVVAVDATNFRRRQSKQYERTFMQRELNKAYCGFMRHTGESEHEPVGVATGNWGCGAFAGDARLKFLLQLMAAAQAGRSMAYFTFNNDALRDDLHRMHSFLIDNSITVGMLWNCLTKYADQYGGSAGAKKKLPSSAAAATSSASSSSSKKKACVSQLYEFVYKHLGN